MVDRRAEGRAGLLLLLRCRPCCCCCPAQPFPQASLTRSFCSLTVWYCPAARANRLDRKPTTAEQRWDGQARGRVGVRLVRRAMFWDTSSQRSTAYSGPDRWRCQTPACPALTPEDGNEGRGEQQAGQPTQLGLLLRRGLPCLILLLLQAGSGTAQAGGKDGNGEGGSKATGGAIGLASVAAHSRRAPRMQDCTTLLSREHADAPCPCRCPPPPPPTPTHPTTSHTHTLSRCSFSTVGSSNSHSQKGASTKRVSTASSQPATDRGQHQQPPRERYMAGERRGRGRGQRSQGKKEYAPGRGLRKPAGLGGPQSSQRPFRVGGGGQQVACGQTDVQQTVQKYSKDGKWRALCANPHPAPCSV